MKLVSAPDACGARQVDVRSNPALRADAHLLVNHSVSSHRDCGIKLRFGMNDGGWVNHSKTATVHAPGFSRVKIAQLAQRNEILRTVVGCAPHDDVVKHFDFEQLPGAN